VAVLGDFRNGDGGMGVLIGIEDGEEGGGRREEGGGRREGGSQVVRFGRRDDRDEWAGGDGGKR